MHLILQGGSVPPASNSQMPPLPHEPVGFYNDRGATVDIPLDSTKVHDLPLCCYCAIQYLQDLLCLRKILLLCSFTPTL
jgi:hypothetical protein